MLRIYKSTLAFSFIMNILLISLPAISQSRASYSLGLRYLASALWENNNVKIFESALEKNLSIYEYLLKFPKDYFSVMGISFQSQCSLEAFINCVKIIRKVNSRIFIIAGGHYASINCKNIINYVDCVIVGDGTKVFPQIIETLEKKRVFEEIRGVMYWSGERIKYNAPDYTNIATVNPYIYSANNYDKYIYKEAIQLLASSGCLNSCTFCSIPAYRKSTDNTQQVVCQVEHVIENIDFVINNFKSNIINFVDDNLFGGSVEKIKEFCDVLLKRKINIIWSAEMRLEVLEKCIDELNKSGLQFVRIGLESASVDVQKRFRKRISPIASLNLTKKLEEKGIIVQTYFIMFECFTTIGDLRENLIYMKKSGNCLYSSLTSRLYTYQDTQYYKLLEKEERIKPNPYGYDFIDGIISIIFYSFLDIFSYSRYYEEIYYRLLYKVQTEYTGKRKEIVLRKLVANKYSYSDNMYDMADDIIKTINNRKFTEIFAQKYCDKVKRITDYKANEVCRLVLEVDYD